jgi:hypothetical protein
MIDVYQKQLASKEAEHLNAERILTVVQAELAATKQSLHDWRKRMQDNEAMFSATRLAVKDLEKQVADLQEANQAAKRQQALVENMWLELQGHFSKSTHALNAMVYSSYIQSLEVLAPDGPLPEPVREMVNKGAMVQSCVDTILEGCMTAHSKETRHGGHGGAGMTAVSASDKLFKIVESQLQTHLKMSDAEFNQLMIPLEPEIVHMCNVFLSDVYVGISEKDMGHELREMPFDVKAVAFHAMKLVNCVLTCMFGRDDSCITDLGKAINQAYVILMGISMTSDGDGYDDLLRAHNVLLPILLELMGVNRYATSRRSVARACGISDIVRGLSSTFASINKVLSQELPFMKPKVLRKTKK